MQIDYLARHAAFVPTVAAWHHEQFGYLNPAVTLAQRTERLRQSLDTQTLPLTLLALTDTGEPVGSTSITPATLTHAHLTPWLSSMFVCPGHRGAGIASAMARRALAECVRLGAEKLFLFTPHNESLYARLGWKTFDTANINGTPVAVMARSAIPDGPDTY